MKFIKKLPKASFLVILLIGAIVLDFMAYSFFASCPACSSFSHFITTQSSLSAPLIASLSALFALTGKQK
ncbi:hypothetical protein A3A55_01435 [Candidatus Roizmanbacteria bacterium RIFCSPLOWO2_01_FULL_40_14]|nr:MAG: hypothetical protein A3A55_01435 [Candidatus Roizmanbacteria bacterium RIFCSPLOWO2_01_FULL_40_14]